MKEVDGRKRNKELKKERRKATHNEDRKEIKADRKEEKDKSVASEDNTK
jgi:hypothetical protein